MDKKKQRGQGRRLNRMLKHINEFTPFLETEDRYEHFHVPSSMFIESDKTSGKVKTAFCREWIKITESFISLKPEDLQFCKIIAVISVPYYWSSQIIIFYDEEYYNSFWNRNGPEQFWEPIKQKYSFSKERNIETSLNEICYHEKIIDDEVFECDLWFYGEYPN